MLVGLPVCAHYGLVMSWHVSANTVYLTARTHYHFGAGNKHYWLAQEARFEVIVALFRRPVRAHVIVHEQFPAFCSDIWQWRKERICIEYMDLGDGDGSA